jgi:hypothetical protein
MSKQTIESQITGYVLS